MIPDELFDVALQYKKTQLWRRLSDNDLFAVRHEDGEIGYCCVMGMSGELTALAVYPGQAGLDSLRLLTDNAIPGDLIAQMEQARSQDCLMVSFESKADLLPKDLTAAQDYGKRNGVAFRGRNAYPHFERFRPGYERWYLEDAEDQRRMLDGLRAATMLGEALKKGAWTNKFTEGPLYDRAIPLLIPEGDGWRIERHALPPRAETICPAAPLTDDFTRARLMKGKKAGQWAAKVFRSPEPISDEIEGDYASYDDLTKPPFFPFALIVVEVESGLVLSMQFSKDAENWAETLGGAFMEIINKSGLPRTLLAEDDRTELVFGPLCDQLGIRLERQEVIEPLDEALDELVEKMGGNPEELPDMEEIFEMLRTPGAVSHLPDEMIAQSISLMDMGILPNDIADIIRREARQRGFL